MFFVYGKGRRVSRYLGDSTGATFGESCSKDHSILGSILGPPIYGNPHFFIKE